MRLKDSTGCNVPAHWLGWLLLWWLLPDVTKLSVSHYVLFNIPVRYKSELQLECLVENLEAIIPVIAFLA